MFNMQIRRQPAADIAPTALSTPGQGDIRAPRTRSEYTALVARRDELKSQRRELSEQRNELMGQRVMAHTDGSRQALDQRMQEMDIRQLRLDQQINALDDAIGASVIGPSVQGPQGPQGAQGPQTNPWALFPQISIPPRRPNTEMITAIIFGEAVIFVLIGVVIWQTLWRRSLARMRTTFGGGDSSTRLDQLQRAVDVIAVEVERISENQRYVTKVITEKLQSALGGGEAQQLPGKRKVAEPARASEDV